MDQDFEYDDHKRLTNTYIDSTNEYNAFDYCLCGPIKTATYHYIDSLGHAQDMSWVFTTDKAGQVTKVYHPYAIPKRYPSNMDPWKNTVRLCFPYDRAGRRELYSDPTFGHAGADMSGWSGLEPQDETNWKFLTPQAYLYGLNGGMEATGRVTGSAIVAGQGEPYFVKADAANRTSRVLFPDASGTQWRATPPVYQYFPPGTGGAPTPGTIYITGEPTVPSEAPKKWQLQTMQSSPNNLAALTIDGGLSVSTGTLDVSGNGVVTYNGMRMEVVGSRLNEQWTWTHTQAMPRPQMEVQSSRSSDGRSAKTAVVDQSSTQWGSAGPEKYVVESVYDNMGRLIRKVSRDSSNDDDSIRWEASYEYDGKGRMVRREDFASRFARRKNDCHSGHKDYLRSRRQRDSDRLCRRFRSCVYGNKDICEGVSAHGATFSNAGAGVNVITAGSYTYDVNNNMTGTMMASASRSGVQLAYRGQWTFTYDHLNRLKSHTNTNAGGLRTNLWYNPMGQVWQRWTDISGNWTPSLTRYVYDGGMLVQEHAWSQTHPSGSYIYTYGFLSRDYLMQPGGIRQKESPDGINFTDRFLITDGGVITTSIDRQTSTTIKRIELAASGDRQAGGSRQDGKLSNLWGVESNLEGYGGGTSGATGGFDPLVTGRGGHIVYMTGIGGSNQRADQKTKFGGSIGKSGLQAPADSGFNDASGVLQNPQDFPYRLGDELSCTCAQALANASGCWLFNSKLLPETLLHRC